MEWTIKKIPLSALILALLFFLVFPGFAEQQVKIGVLSHRGDAATLKNWLSMADYLSRSVNARQFQVVPLDFDEIDTAVAAGKIDFLLVNPSIYVNMEVRHRISRIATLNTLISGRPYNVFGGVIFTRSDRKDIKSLADIKNKRLMAVDAISLGGYQMGWRALKAAGVDINQDLEQLVFAGIHDQVVEAVQKGQVDVGVVRTGILESMADEGRIELQDFTILNQRIDKHFPLLHSTKLYPEWPFSKLHHTPNVLAQEVAIALLKLIDLPEMADEYYYGWTVPLEYQPVHVLLQDLNLPPYADLGQFTLVDAINKYWQLLLIGLSFILVMAIMTTWVARLNRALKKSKQRLEQQHALILDSVGDGIYGVDLEGNSTFVNKAMEQITGWKSAQVIGLNQHQILHHTRADGSRHKSEDCPVHKTFEDNRSRYVRDDIFWKADGSSFPVEYSSTPLKDEDDKTIGSVVVFRDISQRKQAEKAAQNHRSELAHMARLSTMGEMASGLAHELNQPLTAIAANADASIRLLDTNSGKKEQLMDILEVISTQARRAGGIIQQLRQFIRKEESEPVSVNLNALIEEVILLLRHEIEKEDIQLEVLFDENILTVVAQHIQIDQVIMNLARNAIEAMTEQSSKNRILTIKTGMSEKGVKVTIADNGPGFDKDVLDNLFTPFMTTKAQGMGLGLSISKSIIESHNGELFLEPTERGVMFHFTLPIN